MEEYLKEPTIIYEYVITLACTGKILEKEWKYLTILDACRFDFFEDIYSEYLKGSLRKRISSASSTIDWLKYNFKDFNEIDIVYVSANPYINSYGIGMKGFKATKHFQKIIDVWDYGWDKKMGSVPPSMITNAAKKAVNNSPNKRFIIHYMQPHYPYLSMGPMEKEFGNRKKTKGKEWRESTLEYYLKTPLLKLLGQEPIWKIKKFFEISPRGELEKLWREIGSNKKIWRELYKDNLKKVLRECSKLIRHLEGRVIVTSDHGECLGENRIYGHHRGYLDIRELREVPWLEVEE